MPGKAVRAERVAATRDLILSNAERLFAEHGVAAVSNRQVSEAAGQGNNTAVGYHFGTKADLVRAIVRKHTEQVELLRARMVAGTGESDEVRDWVACMVRPLAQHLADLESPTWFGRFSAQAMTDPAYREIMVVESLGSPALLRTAEELDRCLPDLPPAVRRERRDMARLLMVHMVAERERALAEGGPTPRDSWQRAATGLIDAITGLWLAPVTGG
ncbi:TetR family transcriptional regulator [Amycolatopsis antarctica]|uniref:TetR family transcriptional regulator n=1 Tax=Amycolatopsis antarctica TaxID=1854586 RepID=A0A263CV37_9PSEU|nr:TetR/AcrR family transcriptional regulator [Amycolatopsis antarctica]OZM69971.1 TetR family transcriptional regulator [Amycolatopsis antarctica]